eukprot:CAMPEP_0184005836 /NCGR_PEP_ID=MMETSP0954-20121128/300_1 /TAXON_ID=627963 /ORGANISM="Aplanochytrium sp, Strain PBS07" /LENGTH=315 /DNA_ID=CAMNT_0026284201 /DNA_START=86 /DNA_END=1033 /DNA_ORIENTATION=-
MIVVVDLSCEEEAEKSWAKSMATVGFAVVSNHGVPEEVLQNMTKEMKHFFLSKSGADKMKYNYGKYGNPNGGYTKLGTESVSRSLGAETSSAPPDLVENYVILGEHFQNKNAERIGKHDKSLFEAGEAYYSELVKLMEKIHRLSARALGISEDFFTDFYSPPDTSLRLSHYPPLPDKIEDGQMRYGAHTDYTGFTFLYLPDAEACSGLEIFVEGKWKSVTVENLPPHSFIVNIGDLMAYWSGGRWKSTLHRVANPPKNSALAKVDRFSIPFFTGPKLDSVIVPVNYESMSEEDKSRFKPVLALDHLHAKLGISNT